MSGRRRLADVSTAGVKRHGSRSQGPRVVPALTIASHPNPRRVGERLLLEDLAAGKEVHVSRNQPDFTPPGGTVGMPLADPFLSRKPLVFAPSGEGGLRLVVEDEGTQVVSGEPIRGSWELGLDELTRGVPLELAGRVVVLLHRVTVGGEDPVDALGMVGTSAGLQEVRR